MHQGSTQLYAKFHDLHSRVQTTQAWEKTHIIDAKELKETNIQGLDCPMRTAHLAIGMLTNPSQETTTVPRKLGVHA